MSTQGAAPSGAAVQAHFLLRVRKDPDDYRIFANTFSRSVRLPRLQTTDSPHRRTRIHNRRLEKESRKLHYPLSPSSIGRFHRVEKPNPQQSLQ
jgi:hypothetical protein